MLADELIRGSEFDAGDRLSWNLQSRRRQMSLPRPEGRVDLGVGADRDHFQPHAEFVREATGKFVFRTFRHAIGATIEGQWTRLRHDPQFTKRLDLIDRARQRRASGQQTRGAHCDRRLGEARPFVR